MMCIMPIKMTNNIFSDLINRKICLERQNNCWIWKEADTSICFFLPNSDTSNSIAFSLDKLGKNPQKIWPFLAANPPSRISKMCDVIVWAEIENMLNVFVIEIKKTKYSQQKEAIVQIENGELFCKWILNLLRKYEHIDNICKIIRIYCRLPRRQPSKRPTYLKKHIRQNAIKGKKLLEYNNEPKIYLKDAIGFARSENILINYILSND